MNHGGKLASVLVVSGALVTVEVLGEKKVHGEFNVPAPSMFYQVAENTTNTTNTVVILQGFAPLNGPTVGAPRLVREIKG